jgi:2'-hydroxyisoflavone reductase
MRLLILGGTVFLGRHLAEAALERDHTVTLFHRGKHNPNLFPRAETLHGDRDGNLRALEGREWDAVIDTSGYVPRVVDASAALLRSATDHYTFVSSISVYAGFSDPGITEDAPLGALEDPSIEEITGTTYGPLKGLCEEAVLGEFGDRALIVRPGLIVGPYDYTDRFGYWVRRIADGGDVLVPDAANQPVQVIDARDLAVWMLDMIEERRSGMFNATGPEQPLTFGSFLQTCVADINPDARLVPVSEAFLAEQQVQPWSELPLWMPSSDRSMNGFMRIDCRRAIATGLRFRPLAATIRDTLAWEHEHDKPAKEQRIVAPGSLSRAREAELLAAWAERDQSTP